jgi:hypothetical protein
VNRFENRNIQFRGQNRAPVNCDATVQGLKVGFPFNEKEQLKHARPKKKAETFSIKT